MTFLILLSLPDLFYFMVSKFRFACNFGKFRSSQFANVMEGEMPFVKECAGCLLCTCSYKSSCHFSVALCLLVDIHCVFVLSAAVVVRENPGSTVCCS